MIGRGCDRERGVIRRGGYVYSCLPAQRSAEFSRPEGFGQYLELVLQFTSHPSQVSEPGVGGQGSEVRGQPVTLITLALSVCFSSSR